MAAKPTRKDINITDLLVLPEFQARAAPMNTELLYRMESRIKKKPGEQWQTIRVCDVEAVGLIVTDGHKRITAYKNIGRKKIRCAIFKCSYLDAVADAVAANRDQHAEPLTGADKHRAIRIFFEAYQQYGMEPWTDAKIADHIGDVSAPTVAMIRKELAGSQPEQKADPTKEPETLFKKGRDGKSYGPKHQAPPAAKPAEELPKSKPWTPEPVVTHNPDADDPPEAKAKPKEPPKPRQGAEAGVNWRELEPVWRILAQLPDAIRKYHPDVPAEALRLVKEHSDNLHGLVVRIQAKCSKKPQ